MNSSPKEKVLTIMLVRHGETDWNKINRFQSQSGVGLNERGMAQADGLASTLKGESLQEVQKRAWVVVEEVAHKVDDGSVLFCGHNFMNVMILCKVLGLEVNHFRRLRQGVGSLSSIERVRGLYSLTLLNDTCHLRE